jgi:hypothetical protein
MHFWRHRNQADLAGKLSILPSRTRSRWNVNGESPSPHIFRHECIEGVKREPGEQFDFAGKHNRRFFG